MTIAGLVAFNLLVNGVLAFALAALLSWAAVRYLRVPPGRAHLALTAIPFAKLAFDLARGIPADSFFWQRAAGIPRDLGSFKIGVGLQWFFLRIDLALGALARGTEYPESAADLLATVLTKRVAPWLPGFIALALTSVALVRLGASAREWLGAAKLARELRKEAPLETRTLGRRQIPIYLTRTGSPYAGGLWWPHICFPQVTWAALTSAEREAAVAHELGHLADRHLWLSLLAGIIQDLFWFVPAMASVRRRLRDSLELCADQWAIARGHAPTVLASALIRVAQTSPTNAGFTTATCGAARGSATHRIRVLLGEHGRPPRLSLQRPLVRGVFAISLTATLLNAITLGNH